MSDRAWMIGNEIATFIAGILVGILALLAVFAFLPDKTADVEEDVPKRGVHSVETYNLFIQNCPEEHRHRVAAEMLQMSEEDYLASIAEATVLHGKIEALRAAVKRDFPDLVKE